MFAILVHYWVANTFKQAINEKAATSSGFDLNLMAYSSQGLHCQWVPIVVAVFLTVVVIAIDSEFAKIPMHRHY